MGKSEYAVKKFDMPTKRYCQTLNLKDHPALITEYRKLHSKEKHWTEIREGIRSVGILEMEIYIHKNLLFMIIKAPEDFNFEEAMNRLAYLPQQEEWEACVARFQE